MAISNLGESKFISILARELAASRLVDSPEYLLGRSQELDAIQEAVSTPGRQIFIIGERGVGKSSLARTAAGLHQGAGYHPIIVTCEQHTTFDDVVQSILANVPSGGKRRIEKEVTASVGFASGKVRSEETQDPQFGSSPHQSLDHVVKVLNHVASQRHGCTVVVIDEFDLIRDQHQQVRFANLLKQLGDQRVPLKFVFCGIASSLDELFAAHNSSYRYIETIDLPRLGWAARAEIVERSAAALGLKVPEALLFRISAISDGFPYYIHLLCEKLYWQAFRDESMVSEISRSHYLAAIDSATRAIQQQLRNTYRDASLHETDDYQHVLWAVADHTDLTRSTSQIVDSYMRIAALLIGEDGLPIRPIRRQRISALLRELRGSKRRAVLRLHRGSRSGFHEFSEPVLRGYVRLVAEAAGVELHSEHRTMGTSPDSTVGVRVRAKSKAGQRHARWLR